MEGPAPQPHSEQGVMPDFDIRDYITNNADGEGNQLDMFSEFQPHPPTPSQMNMDAGMAPQSILGSHNSMDYVTQGQPQSMMMAEMLKGRLEQQMKLQHLQQLQNQILQQQIELISGQSSMNQQQKDTFFHGLLTPGPSTELRAMVPKDLVSPMMLQQDMYINNGPSPPTMTNQLTTHRHEMSMSAPAALAFQTSPPFPLPSPAEPEYDLSPLTSPWLLPVSSQQQPQRQPSGQGLSEHAQSRPRLKRAGSSSRDEQSGMRKRASPNMHPAGSHARNTGSSGSPSSPSTSTSPTTTDQRSMGGKLGMSHDTPSPVDLSMPPPAPPASNSHPSFSSASSSTSLNATPSTSASPNISPVTPASIMNLQGLPTGLVPSHFNGSSSTDGMPKRPVRSKSAARTKSTTANGVVTRGRRGSVAKPGISPNLKPILPGAVSSSPLSPLAQPSHFPHGSSGFGSPSLNGIQGPRKTSHKAAEQKRRDSLKTSFDELRLLLPPVPLPDDAGDEPPLPGSMPPRGPPKGDADGPNRGVSKLALLRCGNTYIRDLKGKVGRRDTEIERLRAEVRRLRTVSGDPGGQDVDLERDVDEGEYYVGPIGGYGEDGDEDGE